MLALDERLAEGALGEDRNNPHQHRSGGEDADLVRSEQSAQHECLSNEDDLDDDQADRGHPRASLEHIRQIGGGLGPRFGLNRSPRARPLGPGLDRLAGAGLHARHPLPADAAVVSGCRGVGGRSATAPDR